MTENELKNIGEQLIGTRDLAKVRDFASAHPHLATHLLRQAIIPGPNTRQLVEFLLAAGADPDEIGHGGDNALHNTAAFNDIESARILLAAGADINAPGAFHFNSGTPLACAAGFGYRRLVDFFLERGATVYNGFTAAGAGRLDLLKAYILPDGTLRADADAAWAGIEDSAKAEARVAGATERFVRWWFGIACRNNQVEVARYLLDLGFDIPMSGAETFEYQGDEWAHIEPENESREVVCTLLRHMILRGYDELAEQLRERGAPLDPVE